MNVKEYSLKFFKFSKYATSLLSKRKDDMSRFLTGISEELVEECQAAMVHESMDLSRLIVHVQRVENKLGGLTFQTRQVPAEVVVGALLEAFISPNLRGCISVQGTITLRGVRHSKDADLSERRVIEVMCSILDRNLSIVAIFTMESAD